MKLDVNSLRARGACDAGIAALLKHSKGTGAVDYGAWSAADSLRVWTSYGDDGPKILNWLERRGLIPFHEVEGAPSVAQRRKVIEELLAVRRHVLNHTVGPVLKHGRHRQTGLFGRVAASRR